jgi:MFS transporter, PHS family, inorganic phosphate transporter
MSDLVVPVPAAGLLTSLDDSKVTRFQLKIMLISGMGFFTDAYDLFVIGIVVALPKPEWSLSVTQVSLLNSVTLAASALGAILFGRVADILGRERIYGFEVLILAIGALASALAPNLIFLIVWVPSRGSAPAATTRSQRPS